MLVALVDNQGSDGAHGDVRHNDEFQHMAVVVDNSLVHNILLERHKK
ncbi:hypothetical protein LDG_6952 [Legionella drancourtii LLAP12]|uniref:Uncharacterized protein n=1 Tax=Legionella drancourtii LLAP12 TaxID=658187 RepID=G9ENX3_9GAMM|nr:hypothetical protein LDG_6952 [Legionella drancourtii LLAP12]